MSVDDVAQRVLLALRELERKDASRGLTDPIVDHRGPGLAIRRVAPLSHEQARLKEEELLEDQPALRLGAAGVERLDVGAPRRKMRLDDGEPSIRQPAGRPNGLRQRVRQYRGQLGNQPVHEPALHPRRHRAGLLVDRHDAPRVHGLVVFVARLGAHLGARLRQDLVLGTGELQAAAAAILESAVEDDAPRPLEHVGEEGLIGKHRADGSRGVPNDHLEQPESRPPRRAHSGGENFAE